MSILAVVLTLTVPQSLGAVAQVANPVTNVITDFVQFVLNSGIGLSITT